MRSKQSSNRPDTSAPAARPTTRTNLQRRGFLLTLGVGGAGAAVIAANKLAAVSDARQTHAVAPAEGKGYAINDHIRRYYRTAKV